MERALAFTEYYRLFVAFLFLNLLRKLLSVSLAVEKKLILLRSNSFVILLTSSLANFVTISPYFCVSLLHPAYNCGCLKQI